MPDPRDNSGEFVKTGLASSSPIGDNKGMKTLLDHHEMMSPKNRSQFIKNIPGWDELERVQAAHSLYREGRRGKPDEVVADVEKRYPKAALFNLASAVAAAGWNDEKQSDAGFAAMNVLFNAGTEEDARTIIAPYLNK